MVEPDNIYLADSLQMMREMPDKCVDLIVTDPPYSFKDTTGAGFFGTERGKSKWKDGGTYQREITPMKDGITDDFLIEMCRVCKIPNIYLFCSKDQVPQFLNFGLNNKLNFDILAWHKPNPIPACGNKYLSDTEYIIFLRGKGARVYGTFDTKRKYFLQNSNVRDKHKWGHPTIKPLNIVQTLITNSSLEGGVIPDPFAGSGTTAIASMKTNRRYICIEKEQEYFNIMQRRIKSEIINPTLF